MSSIHFPKSVTVTDQVVDCASMSDAKKAFAIDFTQKILVDFKKNREAGVTRKVVGIAGPSGSGKSFLSVLAREIGRELDREIAIVPVSIDAFHFTNEYLKSTTKEGGGLIMAKGRFDTYDISALIAHLEAFRRGDMISFPVYSRKIHDPIQDVVKISAHPTMLIIEGLWLLFNKEGWENVKPLLDEVYYIHDDATESRLHTLRRHILGGRSRDDAQKYYEESDMKNRNLVVLTENLADKIITWTQ